MGVEDKSGVQLSGDEYDALLGDLASAARRLEEEGDRALNIPNRTSNGQSAILYNLALRLKLRHNGLITRHGGGPRPQRPI